MDGTVCFSLLFVEDNTLFTPSVPAMAGSKNVFPVRVTDKSTNKEENCDGETFGVSANAYQTVTGRSGAQDVGFGDIDRVNI